MKQLFDGEICPICHARFFSDDDVVFCPECGTPHHRDCWQGVGHCAFEDQHGVRKPWTPKDDAQKQDQDKTDNYGGVEFCPSCGRYYPEEMGSCPVCKNHGESFAGNGAFDPFGNTNSRGAFGSVIDVMGGVDSKTDIGGVTAGEAAPFVASNTRRYMPVFAKKKMVNWNWAAFLIPEYWFFFRKCNLAGVIAATLSLCSTLLEAPFLKWVMELISGNDIKTYSQIVQLVSANISNCDRKVLMLILIGFGLSIVSRVVFGLFGDYIYRRHCVSKINEIKQDSEIDNYGQAILRKGGVSLLIPVVAYIALYVLEPLLLSVV